ncbi:hypothetical protein ABT147_43690 [Streptomyces sp. NPDC001868]|uniref:hypothetical protein n=1 Tax=Streptomyces sp. NPDC001868 TaxID=3154401 RepID=UPI0033342CCB
MRTGPKTARRTEAAPEIIRTVAFSAGSAHVPLQRHPIGTAQAVIRVCVRAGGGDLAEAQWHTRAPDLPCPALSRPGESSSPWRARAPGPFEESRGRVPQN